MRELEKEYEGQFTVTIGSADSDEGKKARLEYGWDKAELLHGLVTTLPDGTYVGDIGGHRYGKPEIEAKIKELLAAAKR